MTQTENKKRVRSFRHRFYGFFIVAFSFSVTLMTSGIAAAIPGDYTWTSQPASPSVAWQSVASSSDGQKLVAASATDANTTQYDPNAGWIYTSTDGGAHWTQRTAAGNHFWQSVASSSDGQKLVAADSDAYNTGVGYIYTSTDGGATWTTRTASGARNWSSVSSTSDGTTLFGSVFLGSIYKSTDSGATWATTAAGTSSWGSLAMNSTGTKIVATAGCELQDNGYSTSTPGTIKVSTDSGVTWTVRKPAAAASNSAWCQTTISEDGLKLSTVAFNGYLSQSIDGGVTWTQQLGFGTLVWRSITASADGTHIAAYKNNGSSTLYTSTDSGTTWQHSPVTDGIELNNIVSNPSGSRLVALEYNGPVYTAAIEQPIFNINGTQAVDGLSVGVLPIFSGTAKTGSMVTVTVTPGIQSCVSTADSSGNWSCSFSDSLAAGSYAVTALIPDPSTGSSVSYGAYAITVAPAVPNTAVKANHMPMIIIGITAAIFIAFGIRKLYAFEKTGQRIGYGKH